MPPNRTILAFDTSAAHVAAALLSDGKILGEVFNEQARGQAEDLMPVLQGLLLNAGMVWADLDCIGVGIGPGNFTGIRISVSAARGLALGLGIPAVGVSGFDQALVDVDRGHLAVVGAPRGQVYAKFSNVTPILTMPDALPSDWITDANGVVGPAAQAVADATGLPTHPATLSPALAVARYVEQLADLPTDRPKPMYIKPADAAPSTKAVPSIV